MARIVEAIGRYRTEKVNCLEAVELLGMSERHFLQLPKGAEGIAIAVAAGPPGGGRNDQGHGLFSYLINKERLAQVARVLRQLQIEHVALNSAPGRSRMERQWGTLRSRLRPPLRRAGVGSDIEAANRWLTDVYMASHNSRSAVDRGWLSLRHLCRRSRRYLLHRGRARRLK